MFVSPLLAEKPEREEKRGLFVVVVVVAAADSVALATTAMPTTTMTATTANVFIAPRPLLERAIRAFGQTLSTVLLALETEIEST